MYYFVTLFMYLFLLSLLFTDAAYKFPLHVIIVLLYFIQYTLWCFLSLIYYFSLVV